MELLEFLGMLEDDDTHWMVPCGYRNFEQDDERDDVHGTVRETDYATSE